MTTPITSAEQQYQEMFDEQEKRELEQQLAEIPEPPLEYRDTGAPETNFTIQELEHNSALWAGAVEFGPRRLGNRAVYTGADIKIMFTIEGEPVPIGNISALSYSIHREKVPVRTLGHTYPRGFTRGTRTIAGTLAFSVFDRYALDANLRKYKFEPDAGRMSSPLIDQLPPFDVTITYQNEFGDQSTMRLYGVEITDEGQTHSIDDMMIENIMQYVAEDIEVMGIHTELGGAVFATIDEMEARELVDAIADTNMSLGNIDVVISELQCAIETIRDHPHESWILDPHVLWDVENVNLGDDVDRTIIVRSGKYMRASPPIENKFSSDGGNDAGVANTEIRNAIYAELRFLRVTKANLDRQLATLEARLKAVDDLRSRQSQDADARSQTWRYRDDPSDADLTPTDADLTPISDLDPQPPQGGV